MQSKVSALLAANTNSILNVKISPDPSFPKRGVKKISPFGKGGLKGDLKRTRLVCVLIALATTVLVLSSAAEILPAQEKGVLFREDFRTLDDWKPVYFPKIKNHSVYTVGNDNGRRYLKTESQASASAIMYKDSFSVSEYPRARWRWKVDNVYVKGDARTKEGDDYPIRVYVMFEYEPERAATFEKMKYGLAKQLYGEYPPHSSLSYVWANKDYQERTTKSPYTDRAMVVFLEKGRDKAGVWQEENVNILEDYRKAFGAGPPARARIAIMNDSDNTGESSVSYVEYLEVYK
jgi:hypothetical protein